MKTHLNSIKQFQTNAVLAGMCVLLTFGCKQGNNPIDTSKQERIIEGLNINVKYAELYNQTEITYSRIWPEGISTGFQKANASSTTGGELLVDYERTKEVVAFDEEGYMSTVSEFLEGDGEMNMPEEAYHKFKDIMPARSNDYDPVVRIEYSKGVERQIGKSGKVKYENAYDEELFKVDPHLLDSLNNLQDEDVESSIRRNLRTLESRGQSFDIFDNHFALFTVNANKEMGKNGIVKLRYVEDLRTGEIVRIDLLNEEGNHDSIMLSKYKKVNGVSVQYSEEIYRFGKINGGWGVTGRTVTNKSNIRIIKN
jgi:hypothetical protein